MAGSAGKAPLVAAAASVAVVEALKDQAGLCRWNYALRSLHQSVAAPVSAGAKWTVASWSSAMERWRRGGTPGALARGKRTEESLSKVMYWEAWGPK